MKFPWSHSTLVDVLKNDSKNHHECDKIYQDIINGKLSLAEFVQELGPALTNEDNQIRMKGTMLLSEVLEKLPADLLNDTQLEFIVTFYCDRMKDHHSNIPAILRGIHAITQMNNLPDGAATKLLGSLFMQIPCQSQQKDDRTKYIKIIARLAEVKKSELLAMNADFISGVIGAIEGERDPQNLLFLFDYMPMFFQNYPLLNLSEEMFEVFACYFPIDFYPNPDDPVAITRDLLALKLENCLCGSKEFTSFCIVLLLEKLDSELNIAKLDSLRLLIKCIKTFNMSDVTEHQDNIWNALKSELLPGHENKEIIQLAHDAILQLLIVTNSDAQIEEKLLTTIFLAIMGSIAQIASRQFEHCVKIALVCSEASPQAASFVVDKLIPIILSQLQTEELTEQQKCALIDVLQRLMVVCKRKNILKQLSSEMILAVQTHFVQILVQEYDTSELKRIALAGLISIPEVIIDENRFVVYTTIVHVLLSSDDARLDIEECLYQFAYFYPAEVMNVIVDKLIAKKYELVSSSTERIFHSLSKLLPLETLSNKINQFFMDLIFKEQLVEPVTIAAMKTLEVSILGENGKFLASMLFEKYKVIQKIIEQVRKEMFTPTSDYLFAASTLMRALMTQLSPEVQKIIIADYLSSMDLTKTKDLYLTSGILGYLDETISLENHFEHLVNSLTTIALHSEDDNEKQLCHHLLCSLFNRMPDDEHHRNVLLKLIKSLRVHLKNNNKKVVSILSWMGKGLLTRGHPLAGEIVEDIAELLDHPSLGNEAVLAFEILAGEFSQLHLPLIKNLFKQKLFIVVMKKLECTVERYLDTHLRALAQVYKYTPHVVLKMNIEKVGPILLKCLLQMNNDALENSLKIIARFVKDEDVFFRDHLQTIVPQLLKLSVYESSMHVRIDALQCLLHVTKYPPSLLLPFKQDVVLGLRTTLDDHKRLVRNASVAARLQWFLVGTDENKSSG
ncbi:MMS19 nucleotide excision repair protein [Wyeomyia smithii]|uniref:MMS19 nucleotide excision repair protein n=1 Tax=Wyeomyia smithii TaxID=174621 RepID=UPI0024681340|nr:MMS19 nucleotide excision repair protein [Wyeomyia smithii]